MIRWLDVALTDSAAEEDTEGDEIERAQDTQW